LRRQYVALGELHEAGAEAVIAVRDAQLFEQAVEACIAQAYEKGYPGCGMSHGFGVTKWLETLSQQHVDFHFARSPPS
jgi:hypothetical protein